MPEWGYRAIAYGLAALVLVGFGWVRGAAHEQEKRIAEIAAQAKAAIAVVVRQGKVTERVLTKYEAVAGATERVVQYVDREVVKYAQSNPGVCLDPDWRRLHDAAAAGAVPAAAGLPDGALPAAPASAARAGP